MTQQTKRPNLLPYLLVLLVLVGVYGFMNKPVEAEPSYAKVRELFESEQVSAFTVTDTTLRMKLREPIDGKTELKKDLFSVTLFYDDLGELIEQQKADGIIEDILDSGNTLYFLKNYFMTKGASSVTVVTLLDKPARRTKPVVADLAGFEVPDEFVVGYGLDYAQKYRNMPYIGVLKPEVYAN